MNDSNLRIINEIKEKLKALKASKKYFSRLSDFTRDRVFTFETVFFLIADLPRLSLNVEVTKGLKVINELLGKNTVGTKGGFCKARKKIKPELFEAINNELLEMHYQSSCKRWKGFILRAVDGSIVDMIDTTDNREKFGIQKNQHGGTVQARMMIGYDVLNKLITHHHLGNLSVGEGNVVKQWISKMKADELNIYDRLYPGASLQYLHHYNNVPYVMRCKLGHNKQIKAFVKSGKREKTEDWVLTPAAITELKAMGIEVTKHTTMPVRMIRIELDDGEVEVLITSLIDNKKYPYRIFKALYFKRWGVETEIGFLKNTLQIEIASGKRTPTIYQDFYATIFRANVQGLIEQDSQPEVQAINQKRVYDYAINRTAAAGNLKGELAKLFLSEHSEKIYEELNRVFVKCLEPIRPDRKIPRNKKSQKLNGKYKPMKNYKRAI